MRYRSWGEKEDEASTYTSSMKTDSHIWREVVLTMKAHVIELYLSGYINRASASSLLKALNEFKFDPSGDFEDVHEALESHLLSELGEEGGWVGLGRSRNDHVATALRLKMRTLLIEVLEEILNARLSMIDKSLENRDKIFVAFTHFQPAQPSTLSHYLLYLEEEMASRWRNLFHMLRQLNRSPLGSGASVGTLAKLNREREAEFLGFQGVVENTLSATSSRADLLSVSAELVVMLTVISRVAEDLILLSSLFIDLMELPDSHVSTSSLMPHKRNAVTAEMMRAKTGEAIGELAAILSIYKGIPSGYNLDLQQINAHLWSIADSAKHAIMVLSSAIKGLKLKEDAFQRETWKLILSADEAELRAIKGKPFRRAYFEVSEEIRNGRFTTSLSIPSSIYAKEVLGSPNPAMIEAAIQRSKERLHKDSQDLSQFKEEVEEGIAKLRAMEDELV